ncbi:hypothetical protein EGM88_07045 [Aureibaculum marinum]|uniref:DUF2116 family Zn-ribbon domain-containing protein n=1 Tax=Aureibaculum marinum TaxID=2487930 RepID=A0A3N4PFC4_9FLAO|nr:hypothetical protein [Aureibaculum marinum]RPD98243.1 hypothetical protein EGM88_07045 [Aureibaculum marinum]
MKCIICKKEIKGRIDKKFCSIKCKNRYHTNLRSYTKTTTVEIDKILHRNRAILLELVGKSINQKKIKRLSLAQKNFNFKYITHYNFNKQGKIYNYIYDVAWMEFSNDEVLIIRTN